MRSAVWKSQLQGSVCEGGSVTDLACTSGPRTNAGRFFVPPLTHARANHPNARCNQRVIDNFDAGCPTAKQKCWGGLVGRLVILSICALLAAPRAEGSFELLRRQV